MALVYFPWFILALQQAQGLDSGSHSADGWTRLSYLLLKVVVGLAGGAFATKGYFSNKARFVQTALSPAEREAVARKLAAGGDAVTAAQLTASSPEMLEAQARLFAGLSPDERAAVAARLATQPQAPPGSLAGWTTEPPARLIITSREASARLHGTPTAPLLPAQTTQTAAAGPDRDALLGLWDKVEVAFGAWVRTPAEQWLTLLDAPQSPHAALAPLAAVIAEWDSALAEQGRLDSRFMKAVRDDVVLAQLVLQHTRAALADGQPARERSIQIANAAQYALRELPAAVDVLRRLSFEEKLQGL